VTLPFSSHAVLAGAVDLVGRHAGNGGYIQGSPYNSEKGVNTDNLWWMLYSVYAVLEVSCTQFMPYSVLTHDNGMEGFRGMS